MDSNDLVTKSLKSTLSLKSTWIIEVHLITTRAHPITYIYMNLRLQLNSWPL
jgi:hypothetical protein